MDALWHSYVAIVLAIVLIPRLVAWWFTSEGAQRKERDVEERDPANIERLQATKTGRSGPQPQQQLGLNEGLYRQWLKQRRDERRAVEKERVRLQYLSPKAFAQLVADLPSIHCSVEHLLEMAERRLPKGSPQFFWDTIRSRDSIFARTFQLRLTTERCKSPAR
jgi:hypothetical protein